jgi:hypothetical protein
MNCILTEGHMTQAGVDIGNVQMDDYSVKQIISVGRVLNGGGHTFNFPTYEGAHCSVAGDQLAVRMGIGASKHTATGTLDKSLAVAPCAGITFIFATSDSKEGAHHTVFIYRDKKTGIYMGMDSLDSRQIKLNADNLKSAIAGYVMLRGNPNDTGVHQVDIFFPTNVQNG